SGLRFHYQNVKSGAHGHGGAVLVENIPASGGRIFVIDADGMAVIHARTAAWVPVWGDDEDRIWITVAERVLDFGDVECDGGGGGAVDEDGRRGADAGARDLE